MQKESIKYIQEEADYLKIQFFSPYMAFIKVKLILSIILSIISIIVVYLGLNEEISILWTMIALILIFYPLFFTISFFTILRYPLTLIFDVKKDKLYFSNNSFRFFTHSLTLSEIKKVYLVQLSKNTDIKDLAVNNPTMNLNVPALSFQLLKKEISFPSLNTTTQNWYTLLSKIQTFLLNNNIQSTFPNI